MDLTTIGRETPFNRLKLDGGAFLGNPGPPPPNRRARGEQAHRGTKGSGLDKLSREPPPLGNLAFVNAWR